MLCHIYIYLYIIIYIYNYIHYHSFTYSVCESVRMKSATIWSQQVPPTRHAALAHPWRRAKATKTRPCSWSLGWFSPWKYGWSHWLILMVKTCENIGTIWISNHSCGKIRGNRGHVERPLKCRRFWWLFIESDFMIIDWNKELLPSGPAWFVLGRFVFGRSVQSCGVGRSGGYLKMP